MKIVAHRGFWLGRGEQNTVRAFQRALDYGFGIELDLRDAGRRLVISHDLPRANAPALAGVLHTLSRHRNFGAVLFALNIKSDGIEGKVAALVRRFDMRKNSFVFDMSVPSQYIFHRDYHGVLACACRHSDVETEPVLYRVSRWVWMDELQRPWIRNAAILRHLARGKQVVIVSPELHQRPHRAAWQRYRRLAAGRQNRLALCTDLPVEAREFFGEERR